MPTVELNYLAILVAGLSSMVVGSIIYAKPVLGKMWMESMGFKDEDLKDGAVKAMGIAFVLSLIMSFVLAHIIDYVNADTAWLGAQTAFWVWLGFVVTQTVTHALFNRSKMTAVYIFLFNTLLTLLAMGIILAVWQ